MLIEETITAWLTEKFTEESFRDLFIVDIVYKPHKLEVFLDSDTRLDLDLCAQISRWLGNKIEEQNLIEESYHLEVSSAGLDKPLKLHRQYLKNIGREVKVVLLDGKILEGQLKGVVDDLLHVEQIIIEKDEKKKKVKKVLDTMIHLTDINKIFVQIKF